MARRFSKVQFWTQEDGVPEKAGKYWAVDDLHIRGGLTVVLLLVALLNSTAGNITG